MVQSKQLRALLQTVKQSISKMMVKHCKTGKAACSPKSRLISPITVQASCTVWVWLCNILGLRCTSLGFALGSTSLNLRWYKRNTHCEAMVQL